MARLYEYTSHRRSWPTFRSYVQLDLGRRPAAPDDAVTITLDDARYLVARGHGFESWPALAAFLAAPPRQPVARPVRVVVPDRREPRTLLRSRDLDAVVAALAVTPGAGVAGEGQLTDEMLAALAGVATIQALDLSGCKHVTDSGLRHLRRLPALRHLDLSGTLVTDHGLQIIRELRALEHLSLAWTRVSDDGIGAVAACDRLEHLDVSGTAVRGGALRALEGKSALRHLHIALDDDQCSWLAGLPALVAPGEPDDGAAEYSVFGVTCAPTHLSLRGPVTDRGLAAIGRLQGLYSLDIDDSRMPITAHGLQELTRLPHLSALRVDAKDDWMPVVAGLPRLRYLAAQDTPAGDDGFVALSRSATLEYIWGRRCHNLTRPGFQALAGMPSLKGLSVSCLNVDDTGLSALPAFPALVELMPMDVPDEGFRHVGRCPRLASLMLMYCRDTTDRATEHIAGLALSCYFNSYTVITDRTPALLSHMPSLERVTFDTCHSLTDSGVAALARLPRLRELRVSGRGVTADVARAFGASVAVQVD
jgi:F-box/leucine-rich repeat protein 14